MKTICVVAGKVVMSQDGEAAEAMRENAAQVGGAVSVVTDEEYDTMTADPGEEIRQQIAAIEAQFTTTMQMRVAMQDADAIAQTQSLLAQITSLRNGG